MSNIKDSQWPIWEVFIQSKSGLPYKHAGSLHAPDKEMAIQNARDTYTRRNEGTSIWVVLSDAIVASNPNDQEELFDPMNDKIYRHPTFYVMPEGAKQHLIFLSWKQKKLYFIILFVWVITLWF
jgi:ring-1,2-phenylacetyl-CoA epoxidase subunit PaaB